MRPRCFSAIGSRGSERDRGASGGTALIEVKETTLDPEKAGASSSPGSTAALALKASLPPDPLTIRIELGQDLVAFRRANEELAALWAQARRTTRPSR